MMLKGNKGPCGRIVGEMTMGIRVWTVWTPGLLMTWRKRRRRRRKRRRRSRGEEEEKEEES